VTKRGFGGIYKRGSIYWLRYWHRGTEYRESSGSDSEATARKLLKARIQEMGRPGRFIGPSAERVSFADLADMVRTDYDINRFRSAEHLNCQQLFRRRPRHRYHHRPHRRLYFRPATNRCQ